MRSIALHCGVLCAVLCCGCQAAYLVMGHLGGKLLLFQAGLPSLGPGRLKPSRDNLSLYNTGKTAAVQPCATTVGWLCGSGCVALAAQLLVHNRFPTPSAFFHCATPYPSFILCYTHTLQHHRAGGAAAQP